MDQFPTECQIWRPVSADVVCSKRSLIKIFGLIPRFSHVYIPTLIFQFRLISNCILNLTITLRRSSMKWICSSSLNNNNNNNNKNNEWITSSNEIETNDVNGSRLAEQGPSSGRCSRQGTLVVIMRILSLVRESGLAKRIGSLWSATIEWAQD